MNWIQSVCNRHLENELGANQASGVVEYMTKRVFEVCVETSGQRQRGNLKALENRLESRLSITFD